ncbi:MAG: WecB/TagA/CpsF family glycosyltransferase [Acidimicrobiales bacterium]
MAAAAAGRGGYVCAANVHMVTTARRDPLLLRAMEGAMAVACDGMPLVWHLRSQGVRAASRVAGPDLMDELCRRAAMAGLPVYFIGGTADLLARLAAALRARHAGLAIAGAEAPDVASRPGRDAALVGRVARSGAKLVFVGLGCPKQELWMAANADGLGAVAVGVGAAFAMHAGLRRRAPKVMQRLGLEWLYRLGQEPRRLGPRYAATNAMFVLDVAREVFRRRP